MKIVILDEAKKRNNKLVELLEQKGHEAIGCFGSGEFMDQIESHSINRIFMDITSWQHGMGLFGYFRLAKKMVDIPITFYNAPENFNSISDRNPNQNDKIFNQPVDIDLITNDF